MKKLVLIGMMAVAGAGTARPPNYDEAKVAPYTLEDPLAFADGLFGIENMDYKHLAEDLLENDPELFNKQ